VAVSIAVWATKPCMIVASEALTATKMATIGGGGLHVRTYATTTVPLPTGGTTK